MKEFMSDEQFAEFGKEVRQEFENFAKDHPSLYIRRLKESDPFFVSRGEYEYIDIIEEIDEKNRAEISITLRIECDRYMGDTGNLMAKRWFSISTNWPSWGSTDMKIAMARIALFQKVGEFCLSLQKKYEHVTMIDILMTKEELEEEEKKRLEKLAKEKIGRDVKYHALQHAYNLRVGKWKEFSAEIPGVVPGETYKFRNGYGNGAMREFEVVAKSDNKYLLCRTE